MKENLVIVVDMINGFVNEGALSDQRIRQIIPNVKGVLDKFDKEDIIFVVDAHSEGATEFKAFPPHCIKGTNESEIVDELKSYATVNNTVYKNSTNAFFKLDLNYIKQCKNIILVGCCTDICVLQLALSLRTYFNEYEVASQVTVIEDACDTFSAPHHHGVEYHSMGLSLMKQSGVNVINMKEFNL